MAYNFHITNRLRKMNKQDPSICNLNFCMICKYWYKKCVSTKLHRLKVPIVFIAGRKRRVEILATPLSRLASRFAMQGNDVAHESEFWLTMQRKECTRCSRSIRARRRDRRILIGQRIQLKITPRATSHPALYSVQIKSQNSHRLSNCHNCVIKTSTCCQLNDPSTFFICSNLTCG